LAQLTNPEGLKDSQLNLIDKYLSQANGQALVKEALEIVKPFFLQQMQRKFEAESQKIFEELQFENTQPEVLMYYLFNQAFPNAMNRGPLHRYINFSLKKDTYETVTAALPFLSA
jgi:hypothetical protein